MNRTVAAFLIFIGLGGLALAFYWQVTTPRAELVRVPISLRVGQTTTVRFKPDISFDYEADLVFHNAALPDLVCSIGTAGPPLFRYMCKPAPALDISWTIYDGKKTVAEVNTAGGDESVHMMDKKTAVRVLFFFHADRDVSYVLSLRPMRDASSLNAHDPTLVIQAPSPGFGWAESVMWTGIASIFALLAGVAGLAQEIRRRKRGT